MRFFLFISNHLFPIILLISFFLFFFNVSLTFNILFFPLFLLPPYFSLLRCFSPLNFSLKLIFNSKIFSYVVSLSNFATFIEINECQNTNIGAVNIINRELFPDLRINVRASKIIHGRNNDR